MTRWGQTLTVVVAAAMLSMPACNDDDKPLKPVDDTPGLRLEALPNEQAELTALWLSHAMEAPLPIYERICLDLKRIDSIAPFLGGANTFAATISPIPSKLTLELQMGTIARYQAGGSALWDSLSALFKPTVTWRADSNYEAADLRFPGRLNSSLLAQEYHSLPEVETVGLQVKAYLVGKWRRDLIAAGGPTDELSYVFHGGTGPEGDRAKDTLHCFISLPDSVRYSGTYIPSSQEKPDWWTALCPRFNVTFLRSWCR